MERRSKEKTTRKFYKTKVFLLVVFLGAIFVAISYIRGYYQDYKIKQEIKYLKEEVRTLESKKIESLAILEYVMSDTFIEEKARTELNLKKPGEHVAFISSDGDNVSRVDSNFYQEKKEDLNNPTKWWYYFFVNKEIN
ncbi:MAG: septum formation initiator family protein [Candidatus Magasanikbacteria bacterium]